MTRGVLRVVVVAAIALYILRMTRRALVLDATGAEVGDAVPVRHEEHGDAGCFCEVCQ